MILLSVILMTTYDLGLLGFMLLLVDLLCVFLAVLNGFLVAVFR